MIRILCALTLLVSGLAVSQDTPSMGAEVPQVGSIELSHETIAFDLGQLAYPPPEFPHYYDTTSPAPPASVTLRVFSNIEDGWAVSVDFEGLRLVSDPVELIPASRVEYRLDGANWFPLGQDVTLFRGFGVSSSGYEERALEFRIRIEGNELPGRYEGMLIYSLVPLF